MRHHDIRSHPPAEKAALMLLIPAEVCVTKGTFVLTGLRCIRNGKAVPSEHDWYSQFNSSSGLSNKHVGEPVGFGPMLRSRNDCINILLMLKVV